jgi:ABC-type transporter lipoprotein component MlaA
MKKRVSIHDHIKVADEFREARHCIMGLHRVIPTKGSRAWKTWRATIKKLYELQSDLDSLYHQIATEDEYQQWGSVYYQNRQHAKAMIEQTAAIEDGKVAK